VFDLYCEGDRGEKFIVELQKVKQQFFKDRSLYYATFPIQEEGNKGAWNYRLSEVFTVAVMDFAFDDSYPDQYRHEVKLVETQTGEVFYDKLTLIYLEMPKFSKEASQLETHFDKWLYLLKNLNRFTDIPPVLQEPIFQRAFQIAEVANLNPQDMERYELSLKDKRDWESAIETAVEEGREKGFQQGIQEGIKEGIEKGMQEGIKAGVVEVARNLKRTGLDVALIAQATGLAPEEIEKL
jgi:predicted transposase/invertase (TIGR01784 family)